MFDLLFFLKIIESFLLSASSGLLLVLSVLLIENFYENKTKKILLIGLLFVLTIVGTYLTKEAIYSELRIKAEAGYVIYLDGQEVEADTIEFRQYRIWVKNEDKVIMLTPKRKHSYRYVHIPIIH